MAVNKLEDTLSEEVPHFRGHAALQFWKRKYKNLEYLVANSSQNEKQFTKLKEGRPEDGKCASKKKRWLAKALTD